jgi:HNH endonuclease
MKSHRWLWLQRTMRCRTDDCLVWPYASLNGYGKVWHPAQRRVVSVHVVACEFVNGSRPEDMEAAHGPCHNRLCFNPRHLSWKTRRDNKLDRHRDGTGWRLTADQVREIRSSSLPVREIQQAYGLGQAHVYRIRNGQTWVWLTEESS